MHQQTTLFTIKRPYCITPARACPLYVCLGALVQAAADVHCLEASALCCRACCCCCKKAEGTGVSAKAHATVAAPLGLNKLNKLKSVKQCAVLLISESVCIAVAAEGAREKQ